MMPLPLHHAAVLTHLDALFVKQLHHHHRPAQKIRSPRKEAASLPRSIFNVHFGKKFRDFQLILTQTLGGEAAELPV
ncbi:hypothetical protein SDC9_178745 [bioreactor metagenome]|uniref:Uncharacterized protein n=1 Tax=bioreactor metagenome TaxID=1076179 RepID=A0A645GWK2_9ZZZZ